MSFPKKTERLYNPLRRQLLPSAWTPLHLAILEGFIPTTTILHDKLSMCLPFQNNNMSFTGEKNRLNQCPFLNLRTPGFAIPQRKKKSRTKKTNTTKLLLLAGQNLQI